MPTSTDHPEAEWVTQNALCFAVRARAPLSAGHTLITTRRPITSWFDATPDEHSALLSLMQEVKQALDAELAPHGYHIGFDEGEAAGPSPQQLRVHVIPHYRGDNEPQHHDRRSATSTAAKAPSPRPSPLATGGDRDPFSRHILPLFGHAREVAIVAAFVQESGLMRLRPSLRDALMLGARVRLLTGDYLNITQASALEQLLDLAASAQLTEEDAPALTGTLETRVIEVESLSGRSRSFHPKSWRFESDKLGVAFVGSSNLSLSALDSGIEWNLRVDRERDPVAYGHICEAFEALWTRARPLDRAWVQAYAERAARATHELPPGEVEPEPPAPPAEPHSVQQAALDALARSRADGQRRALVVLATGLGKTWLAAFDFAQFSDELGSRPRLLFLAHRRELLQQAADTFRTLLRARGVRAQQGMFVEDATALDAELVFASVAKLARAEHLERLRSQRFDYVIIDEVHHAAADSYRRILAALDPDFLLGLTATPDRADAADILGLFDDHLAFRADIADGIEIGRLVPFHYHGIKDDIDYANIPWRNRRWDPAALESAVQTEQRMQTLWTALQEHRGTRSLFFCCSVAHARYVREWLRARGTRVNAVFAAEGSDDREGSLEALRAGDIEAICAVDIFNEGVDLPAIDRVVMLRPTESAVVFLQQLGRGLRAHAGKASLTVIDFVGNHASFLFRLRTLLSLGSSEPQVTLRDLLDAQTELDLPAGCSAELSLEAKEILRRLFRVDAQDEVEKAYRELHASRDSRPTAGELYRMRYLPSTLAKRYGSWFDFLREQGHLTPDEQRVLDRARAYLSDIERAVQISGLAWVCMQALVDASDEDGTATDGLTEATLAARAHPLMQRSAALWPSAADHQRMANIDASDHTWLDYCKEHALSPLTRSKQDRRPWLQREADHLKPAMDLTGDLQHTFRSMLHELIDYRLAQHRDRAGAPAAADSFECKLLQNSSHNPILKLPPRASRNIPDGDIEVHLPDGTIRIFGFRKEYINKASTPGKNVNELPDLLRGWFGLNAGRPGTNFRVRFSYSPDGLWIEPDQREVAALDSRRGIPFYPDLRAAAGHTATATAHLEEQRVWLPIDKPDPALFAVRVSGSSMDGSDGVTDPMRDGDWALMRFDRAAPGSALLDRVVLVQTEDDTFGTRYQLKRLKRVNGRYELHSDNPAGPTIIPTDASTVIARLERAIAPESLGPSPGTQLDDDALAGAFGLDELLPRSGRYGGHLFVFIDAPGVVTAPDRIKYTVEQRRPSETCYVLAQVDARTWRYLGVGRFREEDNCWVIPEMDHATWRKWGSD